MPTSVLAILCALATTKANVVTIESPLTGWTPTLARVKPDNHVRFVLVIQEQNLEALKEVALAVSTPGHAEYGRHRTQQQIAALTAPAEADVAVVTQWLHSHGITSFVVQRERVVVDTNVRTAETLLGTRFGKWHRRLLVSISEKGRARCSFATSTTRAHPTFRMRRPPL